MKLTKEDLVQPHFTPKGKASLLAMISQELHFQATAATLAAAHFFVAEFDGKLDELLAKAGATAAAGESMTIDVLKNGSTVLLNTTAFAASGGNKVVSLNLDPDKASFVKGDVFTVTRTYVAGGGPTPIANTTVIARPTFSDV